MRNRITFIMLVIIICILCCACSNQGKSSFEDMNKSEDTTLKNESENTTHMDKQDIREIAYNQLTHEDRHDIREIAYNQLTPEDKVRISGTWESGTLSTIMFSTIMLQGCMDTAVAYSFIGKEVYMIDFPTKDISVPNNMIVYLNMINNKLIGFGIVD